MPTFSPQPDRLEMDAAQYPSPAENAGRHEQNNARIIREMRLEELRNIEDELNFYEKVPLLFLLSADTVAGAQYLLQRLLVDLHASGQLPSPAASGDHRRNSGLLTEWARTTAATDWRPKLIEALAICSCNTVLRRCGLQLDCLRTQFLPHQPDMHTHVHPILKWLVHLCEQLQPADTSRLIAAVGSAHPEQRYRLQLGTAGVPSERYLELWLLVWLGERLLACGDFEAGASTRNRRNHCELGALLRALLATTANGSGKEQRLAGWEPKLRRAQIAFNFTSEGFVQTKPKAVSGDGGEQPAELPSVAATSSSSDRYTVRPSHAGYVLIIDQEYFHQTAASAAVREPLRRRSGSRCDREALRRTFTRCGYECVVHENLPAAQIEQQVADIVRRSCEQLRDSLIVCILSHGDRGVVYGADTVAVRVERIEELLAAAGMVGKPRLLVVQSCQGEREQELVYAAEREELLAADGPTTRAGAECVERMAGLQLSGGSSGSSSSRESAAASASGGEHRQTDICVAQATIPGYVSYRNLNVGTWFIQALCEAIDEHGSRMHITDILTKVNDSVTQKRGPRLESMVPRFASSLRKQFYLPRPSD